MLPGFVNAHYHSELAIGPGLYQFIFERANVFMQGGVGDVEEDDLYAGVLWGLINAIKGGQTATVDMYYGRPGMPDFGCPPALRAYEDSGMRTAFGLVSRDENIYVHEPNERFLARLPDDLADEVRRSPMGYAWPVDDVMATFERLSADWHGRDDRIRIVTAPDWTPACSDDLYRRCRRVADEHGTGMITHALETRSEMLYNLERYGKPALRRLADIGVLTPETVLEHFVWVTDEELGDLRGLRRRGLEQPGVEPAPVQRDLPRARHHGHRRPDRVRDRRHLVLRPRGLLPGAPPGVLPAAVPADVRAAAAGQRGRAPRRGGERRAGGRRGGSARLPRARPVRRPADRARRSGSCSRPDATTPSRSSTSCSIGRSPPTSTR